MQSLSNRRHSVCVTVSVSVCVAKVSGAAFFNLLPHFIRRKRETDYSEEKNSFFTLQITEFFIILSYFEQEELQNEIQLSFVPAARMGLKGWYAKHSTVVGCLC